MTGLTSVGATGVPTVFSGPVVANEAVRGDLSGTILTPAQPNITSVGQLAGLTVSGDVAITGGLTVRENNTVLNTVVNQHQVIVTEDLSLNGRLFADGDASFNFKCIC